MADIGLRQDEAFLRRAFHKSLLPCVLSILSQNINILADGIIVGQRIGTDGLSAINLCVPVYLVLCIVGSFLVSGTAIQASRAIGRRQTEQSGKLYNTAVWSASRPVSQSRRRGLRPARPSPPCSAPTRRSGRW